MAQYFFNGLTPPSLRDTAINITQTVQPDGSVTATVYNLADGSTITDAYVYGANSTTEPTSVIRGSLVTPPAPTPPTLSSFAVTTAGNTLTYVVTGLPVTALTGTINVSGSNRSLSHVSSGVASISGAAVASDISGITVSVSSSTPALGAAVTNIPVTNNSTVGLPNPPTLSSFAVATAGNTLTYTVTGDPVTALTGVINVSGSNRSLTHVSSGVASISGAAVLSGISGITVSISSSTPALGAAVTNSPVTNNSTASGLNLVPLVWTTTSGASQAGDVVSLAANGSGSLASPVIDSTKGFEVVVTANAQAIVIYLDNDNAPSYGWGAGNTFVKGIYGYGSLFSVVSGGSNVNLGPDPVFKRIAKVGNNLVISGSANGTSWTVLETSVNILVGVTNLYLKCLSAEGAGSTNVKLYVAP